MKIPSSKISGIYIHFKTSRPITPSTEKPFKIHCQKGCVRVTLSCWGWEHWTILFDNWKKYSMPEWVGITSSQGSENTKILFKTLKDFGYQSKHGSKFIHNLYILSLLNAQPCPMSKILMMFIMKLEMEMMMMALSDPHLWGTWDFWAPNELSAWTCCVTFKN